MNQLLMIENHQLQDQILKNWFKQLSYRKQRVYLNQLRLQLKTITGIDPLESTPWSNKS